MSNAENKFNEIVEKFKAEAMAAIENSMSEIHSDMVPYLNEDTESNARYRAANIVQAILRGDFEFDGSNIKVNGWVIDRLTSFDYDALVQKIALVAGDKAKDLRIQQLERQIAELSKYNLSC